MNEIMYFRDQFDFLSNFFLCSFVFDYREWPSSEHAFQAMKTVNPEQQEQIRLCKTPARTKKMGKRVNIRADWEEVKASFMYNILCCKFGQNPILTKRLLSTYPANLIEGNWWHDNTWGNCFCAKCSNIPGQNLLGKILMQIRKDLSMEHINF